MLEAHDVWNHTNPLIPAPQTATHILLGAIEVKAFFKYIMLYKYRHTLTLVLTSDQQPFGEDMLCDVHTHNTPTDRQSYSADTKALM